MFSLVSPNVAPRCLPPRPVVQVECTAPAGYGSGLNLTVTAYRQTAGAIPFAYSPPYVVTVTGVSGLYADRASPVSITGLNFGLATPVGNVVQAPNVTIALGAVPCDAGVWSAPTLLSCTSPASIATGPTNVTVSVSVPHGNGSFAVQESNVAVADFMCNAGHYGENGDVCRPCPDNAQCAGGLTPPAALPGAYALGGNVFLPCSPPEACLGQVNGEVGDAQVGDGGDVPTRGCDV